MKKVFIILFVGVIAFVAVLPGLSESAAKTALQPDNHRKSWAPVVTRMAGKINMSMLREETGRSILIKGVKAFPTEQWVGDAYYEIALSYEKSGEPQKALTWLNTFRKRFPNHRWHEQAVRRATTLNAIS